VRAKAEDPAGNHHADLFRVGPGFGLALFVSAATPPAVLGERRRVKELFTRGRHLAFDAMMEAW
jgi:hypothetical protein